jgi:probable rRNA maturation factor
VMSALFRNSQKALNVLPGDVTALAEFVLAEEGASEKEVSVLFVGDREISDLNAKYLSREGPTDVLAFPMDPDDAPVVPCSGRSCSAAPGSQAAMLGDVVVSAERALDYAGMHGIDPAEEVSLYLVHGILHLIGYDDVNPSDRRKMKKRERELMEGARRRGLLLRVKTAASGPGEL